MPVKYCFTGNLISFQFWKSFYFSCDIGQQCVGWRKLQHSARRHNRYWNINANIFVSDYDTVKMIFTNKLFGEEAGQVPENAECWKMLNAGLGDVCKHCPSTMLYGTIAVKENAYNLNSATL